ncbi:MAG: MFS transporter [Acidobacteriota bacterium]
MSPRLAKLSILAVLYIVQGMPFGFQLIALPAYLREAGLSLTNIGLASALGLPWMFKVVWGPAVDRWGSARFGRRRSWILPLQVGLALSCAAAAFSEPGENLRTLLALVLLMNLFASAMDVAVDGLAIDLLDVEELGYGNITQVVGYKIGMLAGGGLLVWASDHIGWRGLFLAMAALVLLAMAATAAFREPGRMAIDDVEPTRARVSGLGEILRTLGRVLRQPGTAWLLIFIATYKLGETLADAMFRPFLFDVGYTVADIGLWLGTWGLLISLIGSFAGGVLASRIGLWPALAIAASLRATAVAAEWWLSLVEPTQARVIAVIAVEQCFGGMLTTALFAFMMASVDRRIGASHFATLATVEVGGKLLAASLSGVLADQTSYATVFGVATIISFAFLGLLWPLARRRAGQPTEQLASPR